MSLDLIINSIKSVPDYPKEGIIFRDITGLLENHKALSKTIDILVNYYKDKKIDKVAATEARGFLFGIPVALALGIGFVPIRKPNKLPRDVISEKYELEYGQDILELHSDSIKPGEKILLVDDLLATGGTMLASAKLIQRLGGEVKDACFVISLPDLGGRKILEAMDIECYAVCEFEGD